MIKYIHIVLAIWIFTVVAPIGFSESFNGRPTETEMDELVTLGTESGHGVYERCYATQYSPNPAYYVSPPTFIGTNGWYLSTSVMQSLDDKAKTLVQYYVDSTTWAPDMGSFGSRLTVTGLWVKLDIGDGVSQFTGTPAMGTNPPTYGDYPWRMYPESLEERYEVLNTLRWTVDNTRYVTNQSWYGMISYWGDTHDPWKYEYSNKVSGADLNTHNPSWIAEDLGWNSEWEYYYKPTRNPTTWEYKIINTNLDIKTGPSPDGSYNTNIYLTWGQVSGDLIEDKIWGFGNWGGYYPLWGDYTGWQTWSGSNSVYARFHGLDTRLTNSLSTVQYGQTIQLKPGTYSWAYKCPYSIFYWWLGDGTRYLEGWEWSFCYYTGKATWMWYNDIDSEINNTLIGVFAIGSFQTPTPLPPFNPVGITETFDYATYGDWYTDALDSYWSYPREWQIDQESPWSELAGLATTNYVKLAVSSVDNWLYMAFGGEGEVTGDLGSMPPHPAEPLDSGEKEFWNNEGSVGTAKGILVNDAFIVRDWDFNYCTDEY